MNNISHKTSTITVEGLGEVHCRELSAGGVSALQPYEDAPIKATAMAVIGGLVDENGKTVFTKKDLDSVMDKMTMTSLNTIAEEVLTLTGLIADEAGEESPNA